MGGRDEDACGVVATVGKGSQARKHEHGALVATGGERSRFTVHGALVATVGRCGRRVGRGAQRQSVGGRDRCEERQLRATARGCG